MANDNILRLKVDSKEYDSKIERARQGLLHLEQTLQKSGKSFNDADKGQVAFVKELGQMSTVAATARGKIGELTKAYIDLSVTYQNMTAEAKKGELGKALAKSLDTLRSRITDSKQQLDNITQSLNGKGGASGGGLFSSDKWSGMLQVFGGNLLTKGVSLAVGSVTRLSSEIQEAVSQGIVLAKQGEGIRNAFARLGRGDLLQGLRDATHNTVTDIELMKAAVKFNDFRLPLEELGTMLAFAQQKAKDTGQSVDYMVDSIVTGLGRNSLLILDNLGLSAAEIKERMKETGDMTSAVGAIIREQMSKAGDYVETAADRATQADVELKNAMEELGRTFQPLSDSANSMWNSIKIGALDLLNTAIKPLIDGLTEAGKLRKQFESINGTGGGGGQTHLDKVIGALRNYSGDKQGLYNRQVSRYAELEAQAWRKANEMKIRYDAQLRKGTNAQVEDNLYHQWKTFEQRAKAWKKMSEEYQKAAKIILNPAASPIAGTSSTTTTNKTGRGGGGGNNTYVPLEGSIDAQTAKVQELQKAWRAAADDDSRKKIKKEIEQAQLALDILLGKTSGIPEMNYGLGDLAGKGGSGLFQDALFKQNTYDASNIFSSAIAHQAWKLDDKAIKSANDLYDEKTEKKEVNLTQEVNKISGGISGILGGIEGLGVEVPEGIKDAVSGIQSVINILSSIFTVASAIQAIATADVFKLWSTGGLVHAAGGLVVPGNNYSGDMVPSMINSGELILNQAQQNNIASQLQEGGNGRGYTPSYVSGEQIWIALNNFTQRTGRGEIITWR